MIVANWKSNETEKDALTWFSAMKPSLDSIEKTIVICPPATLLSTAFEQKTSLQLTCAIGAQDISPFAAGAYTGEVNGEQLKEFVTYVIIGHSERRTYFNEDDSLLAKKVAMAIAYGLIPIFCVQNEQTVIPEGVHIVAYEPVAAIGTGHADSPDAANAVAQKIKEKNNDISVLYGGSVTAENVSSFTHARDIAGVLVGGASLHPQEFSQIITHA